MSRDILFQIVFPILGGTLSAWKSLSPLQTVRLAEKVGDIGSFNPIPQSTFFVNSVTWVVYALMISNPIIYLTNAFCAVVNLTVLFKVFPLCDRIVRKRMLFVLQFGFIFDLSLLCLFIFMQSSKQITTMDDIGKWATLIFNILLYISPLSSIFEIIRDRDTRTVHAGYNLAQFACSGFWTLYGLDLKLIAVWIPNGIGVIVATFLFFLLCIFPSSAKDKKYRQSRATTMNFNRKLLSQHQRDGTIYSSSDSGPQYDIRTRPTTTVAIDALLDTTIDNLETAVKNFRPFLFAEKPSDVLKEEYDQIQEYNSSLKYNTSKRLSNFTDIDDESNRSSDLANNAL